MNKLKQKRIPKVIKILHWIYRHSINSEKVTNLQANQQWETSASSAYISDLGIDYGLFISREKVTNENTGATYKRYWLSPSEFEKALRLLNSYGIEQGAND